jgi:hypothetical protein
MANGLTLIILFTLVVFWLIKRSVKQSKKSETSIKVGYGIPATKEQIEIERQSEEEVMKLLEASVIASGYFRQEKIPELISILRGDSDPFGRTNTKVAFDGDSFLTVEEKRKLGLNTRMKYSKKFIEYFDPTSFKTIEPKDALECMHLDAFHRVSRKKELLKLKKLGFVEKVKIVPVGDLLDCKGIKQLRKIYNIEEVPELPLPGCDASFCRCYYEAIIPNDV